MSLKIIGTGKGIPQKVVSNDDLSKIVDTNDEWIYTRTGIKSRYICTTETLTDLCVVAAKSAIEKSKLQKDEIDYIICSTLNGDYVSPSQACAIAERLDIACPSFDINAACSGFIYALDLASAFIASNKAKNILIVCAEMMSKHIDWNDRATCVLFGDGAGAAVVTKGTALKYINITCKGEVAPIKIQTGNGNNPFAIKKDLEFLYMDGKEIFKFAVSTISKQIKRAACELNIDVDDIDYFLLHQANKRIIDYAISKLKVDSSKFPINIGKYGNISSASIPILLDEMLSEGKIKEGDTLLLSAFGAGLTSGTCVLKWQQ